MLKTLGIHSNVVGNANIGAGHAWLSMHYSNGKSTTVGLWTNSMGELKRFVKDVSGLLLLGGTNDIEFGREAKNSRYNALASRYYELTESQAKKYLKSFVSDPSWRFSNTCASWATRVVKELFRENLNSFELMNYTNTPRALGDAILKLERMAPTSLIKPKKSIN